MFKNINIRTQKAQKLHRLGELLVDAGILNKEKLPEALKFSEQSRSPIGSILIMLGYISEQELGCALQVQQWIRQNDISSQMGVKILEESSKGNVTVETLKQRSQEFVMKNPLGEFLVDGGILTRTQYLSCLRHSSNAGITLSRFLVASGKVQAPILHVALDLLALVRAKKLPREKAIRELKAAAKDHIAIANNQISQQIRSSKNRTDVRLGDLFMSAKIIAEDQLLDALEQTIFLDQRLGQTLVDLKLIPQALVEPACDLQAMVNRGDCRAVQAAVCLLAVYKRGIPLQDALRELGLVTNEHLPEVFKLLRACGVLTEETFEKIMKTKSTPDGDLAKLLVEKEILDEFELQSFSRAAHLIKLNQIRFEQAVIALNYTRRVRCTFDEAVRDLRLTTAADADQF